MMAKGANLGRDEEGLPLVPVQDHETLTMCKCDGAGLAVVMVTAGRLYWRTVLVASLMLCLHTYPQGEPHV